MNPCAIAIAAGVAGILVGWFGRRAVEYFNDEDGET